VVARREVQECVPSWLLELQCGGSGGGGAVSERPVIGKKTQSER